MVERYEAILSFIPERFWSIQMSYVAPQHELPQQPAGNDFSDNPVDTVNSDDDGGGAAPSIRGRPRFSDVSAQRKGSTGGNFVSFSWTRGRIFDFLPAFVMYEAVVNAGSFNVINVHPHPVNRCVSDLSDLCVYLMLV